MKIACTFYIIKWSAATAAAAAQLNDGREHTAMHEPSQ
jgi:hypothetical protein